MYDNIYSGFYCNVYLNKFNNHKMLNEKDVVLDIELFRDKTPQSKYEKEFLTRVFYSLLLLIGCLFLLLFLRLYLL